MRPLWEEDPTLEDPERERNRFFNEWAEEQQEAKELYFFYLCTAR